MVNTNMFRHPKYYKELRKRNKEAQGQGRSNSELTDPASISDQVISANKRDGGMKVRAPGPGLKLGEMDIASSKRQASSTKLLKEKATSVKPQA